MFEEPWKRNASVDFSETSDIYQLTPLHLTPKISEILENPRFEFFSVEKKVPLLLHRGVQN